MLPVRRDGGVPTLGEEPDDEDRLYGLIGAMLDGKVVQFDHGELIVKRDERSIFVTDGDGEQLGGNLYANSADLNDIKQWIDTKVEVYQ